MNKLSYRLKISYLLSLCLLIFLPTIVTANFPTLPQQSIIPAAPLVQAKSYLLMDYSTGRILISQNIDDRLEPASLTKMMTVYVVDQALKNNRVKLTDNVLISETAYRTGGSRMFLELKSEVPLSEILKGVVIQSGNDASVALAEHVAGSEATFAELMNHFAKELGMKDTHFTNVTGLPDPNHYTTAKDMAILAKAVIRDFPETYKMYSQKEFMYKNIKQTNRNRLLWRNNWVDGIKTGHTDNAGYCLVASGLQDNMRLISVVMGAKTDNNRIDETNKLLTYGFRFYESRKLYPALTAVKQARVWMGTENEIDVGPKDNVFVTLGKGQYDKLKAVFTLNKEIKAPLNIGTPVGNIEILLDDTVIAKEPLVSLKEVKKSGIFSRFYDYIALNFHSLWERITS